MKAQIPQLRWAAIGERKIKLLGELPRVGDVLSARFSLPAARGSTTRLTSTRLRKGLSVVSTLPNIGKHACIAQIVDLEDQLNDWLPTAKLFHVSADEPHYWHEVDEYHGSVRAPGFTLHGATSVSQESFARAFGVAVEDHRRIAHGLFALQDGVFLHAEIPANQMQTPDVLRFLRAVRRRLDREPAAQPHMRAQS
jgi:hypothetical protein